MASRTRVQIRLLAVDAPASTVFYAGTFGMKVVERAEGVDAHVALESDDRRVAAYRLVLVGPGRAHESTDVVNTFTLLVEEVEEMRTLCVMADLTGGVSEEPRKLPDGRWEAVLTDPAGNTVRLVQPLPGGADRKRSTCRAVPGRNVASMPRAEHHAPSRAHTWSAQHARSM